MPNKKRKECEHFWLRSNGMDKPSVCIHCGKEADHTEGCEEGAKAKADYINDFMEKNNINIHGPVTKNKEVESQGWRVEFDKRFVRDDGLMDKYYNEEFMADAIKAFIEQVVIPEVQCDKPECVKCNKSAYTWGCLDTRKEIIEMARGMKKTTNDPIDDRLNAINRNINQTLDDLIEKVEKK